MKKPLDTSKRPGNTVHGHRLPILYQGTSGRNGYIENDRKHGMQRSHRSEHDRRP
jgi:hypothetical protein